MINEGHLTTSSQEHHKYSERSAVPQMKPNVIPEFHQVLLRYNHKDIAEHRDRSPRPQRRAPRMELLELRDSRSQRTATTRGERVSASEQITPAKRARPEVNQTRRRYTANDRL
ncbi:hypothetical protein Aduo_013014 [Ancylostoma duodenale]